MNWFPFWPLLGIVAVAALLPLATSLLRPAAARGRREADLALYHAQMAELARERDAGRLDDAAHQAAVLEVQRRLLAAPAEPGAAASRRGRLGLAALLVAVPGAALGLYLLNGFPTMPSAPFALRQEAAARDADILGALRARLAALPPGSDQAHEGWLLLANAERSRGNLGAAAEAFRQALAARFEPEVAGQLAQVLLEDGKTEAAVQLLAASLPRAPGHVGLRFLSGLAAARDGRPEQARDLWGALVAEAPPEAPWRAMVERRLKDLP